ncbi:MAG: type transport system permease protein [Actinomycetota bacterium]|nr:type transport system permease protein [Actinomycetota bacterium]
MTPSTRAGTPVTHPVLSDTLVMTRRNLLHYVRVPSLVIFSTITPVMFVVLFAFVFGGAIKVPGLSYVDFLMPGIFVQTIAFGSTQTGIGLAEDLSRSMVDRFRSLPMTRFAVLAGRILADTLRNILVVVLMTGVGLMVGFRFHNGLLPIVGGLGLLVLFAVAFSWISAVIGLSVGNVEAAQSAGFVWVFPLTFASSAFVPVFTMPGWLQAFAKANPVTIVVDALRALFLGVGPTSTLVLRSLAWIVAITVVFVPLAVRRYRRLP